MQRFMARRATSEDEKEALDRNICGRACNTNKKTS